MSFKRLSLIALLFSASETYSQKQVEDREQTWFGYFNQSRFTNRSGVWVDLHYRLNEFMDQKAVSIARVGYTYYATDQVRLTAGYGYVTAYALTDNMPDVPENRLWQQVQWFEKKKHFSLMQYIRVEERFVKKVADGELLDDSRFNWRFRYLISLSIPLKGKEMGPKTPFIFLNDEVHVNAGREITYNYFDQNRVFAGIGYQFTSSLNASIGYLNVFQQLPAGDRYVNSHAARLFVFHTIDWRSR